MAPPTSALPFRLLFNVGATGSHALPVAPGLGK
jgi:hypothetical protein